MAHKPHRCRDCDRRFGTMFALNQHCRDTGHGACSIQPSPPASPAEADDPFGKNWDGECENCGESPTVSATGLCGPCTFGEAETIGGNW